MSEPTTNGRRVKNLLVSPGVFAEMASGVFRVVQNPLPEGFRIVGAGYDIYRDCFTITVEHPDWPVVPEGNVLMNLNSPLIEKIGDVIDSSTAMERGHLPHWWGSYERTDV